MTCPAPCRDVLALDIGGANIKAADGLGWTHAEPFALWREAAGLADALARIISVAAPARVVATMTGEIADCFTDRGAGVAHIVAATESAAAACTSAPPAYYRVDGTFTGAEGARGDPQAVAAANWHALGRLAAAVAPQARGLLVDVGSTTTDIVPLAHGTIAPLGRDDAGRMLSGELVYTGIERTPVATITGRLPHRGLTRPVASERFADSRDAWLLLGGLAEDPGSCDTADGRPLTRAAARMRLARSLLLDAGEFSMLDAEQAAVRIVRVQARLVGRALVRVASAAGWVPDTVVLSGHGEPLARMALDVAGWKPVTISLPATLGGAVSRCAPAHALARIASGVLA
ncbi:MAG: H4MPT-linked C1 transfer pathway protein [Planctomycetes bacterium]|nr:H4MPT-linked C1 transfer pathway protein [Planctomycetota bacterium]